MRIPRERGFTLIELLIVVAILGVLAAVVIPNVGRFIGRGESEAGKSELANVQSAVVAMMVDNNLRELPTGFVGTDNATSDMSKFPHETAVCGAVDGKYKDPAGVTYLSDDKPGYILYGHDIEASGGQTNLVNYVASQKTKGTYYVDAQGTVYQKLTGYE